MTIGLTMKNKLLKKAYLIPASICGVVIIGILIYYLFASASKSGEVSYLYIDNDDNIDSVSTKLSDVATSFAVTTVRVLGRHTGYEENIHAGRYAIEPNMCSFVLFRNLRNGHQEPLKLVIPEVRTKERLAEELSEHLALSKSDILEAINDEDICKTYGLDTATIISLFIPNTYEVYWNVSMDKFLKKMKTESDRFWEGKRTKQANSLNMTPVEVITLASIVEEETANNGEKPMVAGMYYNRLMKEMPLQADPTIKFALQQFDLKRIYTKLLYVDSPYNTYRNTGLPPGPIRIPSVAGIDAVLNLVHHDYLYMCAKEDFSGTHNFARTYPEHLINAAKYSKALDERGIK